ncbi:MAG TPA: exosome complex RNA-binding protein Csl4 [Thermoplasmata archaeon]
MEPKMVLPGDEIAVAEEFEPGDGTYERNGLVFAATPGVLELDPASHVARVRAFNPPAELRVGDIVYGVVDDIRGMMATATITAIHGRTRQISGESEGTVHISNVSEEYTEDIRDMYRLGDIIRAKVIQVKPSLQLTTAEPSLGVVKALCSVCRGPLEVRGRDLYCPRDERTERRKLAADYADLKLSVPAAELGGGKVAERPRGGGEREGRERGGRDRGGRGGGRDRYRDRGGRGRDGRDGRGGGRGGRDRDRDRRR